MQVEIKIDENCEEPKVIIVTDVVTDEISKIVDSLSKKNNFAGFKGSNVQLLENDDIIRVYSSGGKVYAVTSEGEFILRLRLYEAENRLIGKQFVRISNSEIINLKKVKSFDLSLTGTIKVKFTSGGFTFVSRRYVSSVKKILDI